MILAQPKQCRLPCFPLTFMLAEDSLPRTPDREDQRVLPGRTVRPGQPVRRVTAPWPGPRHGPRRRWRLARQASSLASGHLGAPPQTCETAPSSEPPRRPSSRRPARPCRDGQAGCDSRPRLYNILATRRLRSMYPPALPVKAAVVTIRLRCHCLRKWYRSSSPNRFAHVRSMQWRSAQRDVDVRRAGEAQGGRGLQDYQALRAALHR